MRTIQAGDSRAEFDTHDAFRKEQPLGSSPRIAGDLRDWQPTRMEKILSAAAWTGGALWMVPMASTMMALHKLGVHSIQPVNNLFCRGLITVTGNRWKAIVDPEVRENQPYLFLQNHSSHLDFVAMYPAVAHEIQGLELESHFKFPVYGPYMQSRGTIGVPTARSKRTKQVRDGIARVIGRGDSVLAFPEGTRTVDGRVAPFRRGIFLIARDLGLQVVPTTVTGLYDIMRKGSNHIRPGFDVTVRCDAPVDFAGLTDEEVMRRMKDVRDTISGHVDSYFAEREE